MREAEFFLAKMAELERMASGDKEPLHFYLSAFLSATRSVDYHLNHEYTRLRDSAPAAPAYKQWKRSWESKLSPAAKCLNKFMIDDRDLEVHESAGSRRAVK